jgi:hypothetical protein
MRAYYVKVFRYMLSTAALTGFLAGPGFATSN